MRRVYRLNTAEFDRAAIFADNCGKPEGFALLGLNRANLG
jgi:hypothetical protein